VGRHSSPEQSSFYRSLLGWFLPWVLVAAVAGVAVWIAVGALGQGQLDASPPPSSRPEASPEPTESPAPDGKPSPSPTGGEKERPRKRGGRELIVEGVSVQVLNATTAAGAGDRMAERLSDLGFEIVAVTDATRLYDETTVFWSSEEDRKAARRLAKRFGWRRDPAPSSLSPAVAVHVVVGQDEA
jgi:hypothetical protein